jgi:hypothetical protein
LEKKERQDPAFIEKRKIAVKMGVRSPNACAELIKNEIETRDSARANVRVGQYENLSQALRPTSPCGRSSPPKVAKNLKFVPFRPDVRRNFLPCVRQVDRGLFNKQIGDSDERQSTRRRAIGLCKEGRDKVTAPTKSV